MNIKALIIISFIVFEIRCESNEEQVDEGISEILPGKEDTYEVTDEMRLDERSLELPLVDTDVEKEETDEIKVDEGSPEMPQVDTDVGKEETDKMKVDEGNPEMSLTDQDVVREETDEIKFDEGSPEMSQLDKDAERGETDEIKTDEGSLEMPQINKYAEREKIKEDEMKLLGEAEDLRLTNEEIEKERAMQVGDRTERFGINQHYSIPVNFDDFGRRFVLSYPYVEQKNTIDSAEIELDNVVQEFLEAKKESSKRLVPVKAPPEFVLSIAKQSALLEAAKPKNPTDDIIRKDILRTGDFWDGVWKEDVDKDKLLRTSHKKTKEFEPVRVTVAPGSKLFDLLSVLQERSPKLLYVIYKRN